MPTTATVATIANFVLGVILLLSRASRNEKSVSHKCLSPGIAFRPTLLVEFQMKEGAEDPVSWDVFRNPPSEMLMSLGCSRQIIIQKSNINSVRRESV
jgi:hypothetical protein